MLLECVEAGFQVAGFVREDGAVFGCLAQGNEIGYLVDEQQKPITEALVEIDLVHGFLDHMRGEKRAGRRHGQGRICVFAWFAILGLWVFHGRSHGRWAAHLVGIGVLGLKCRFGQDQMEGKISHEELSHIHAML